MTSHTHAAQIETEQPHASTRVYYIVYSALMALLLLTILAAFLDLGATWGLLVALTIAVIKAALVILYFMHVRDSSRLTWLFVAAGFVWLAILLGLMITDYLTRGWLVS